MHKLFNQLMRNYEHATTKDDKRQYKRIRKKLIKGIIRASKNGKRYFMLPNVNSSSAVKEYLLAWAEEERLILKIRYNDYTISFGGDSITKELQEFKQTLIVAEHERRYKNSQWFDQY